MQPLPYVSHLQAPQEKMQLIAMHMCLLGFYLLQVRVGVVWQVELPEDAALMRWAGDQRWLGQASSCCAFCTPPTSDGEPCLLTCTPEQLWTHLVQTCGERLYCLPPSNGASAAAGAASGVACQRGHRALQGAGAGAAAVGGRGVPPAGTHP
jgi:hypothetical protein